MTSARFEYIIDGVGTVVERDYGSVLSVGPACTAQLDCCSTMFNSTLYPGLADDSLVSLEEHHCESIDSRHGDAAALRHDRRWSDCRIGLAQPAYWTHIPLHPTQGLVTLVCWCGIERRRQRPPIPNTARLTGAPLNAGSQQTAGYRAALSVRPIRM
jgi:hypothetical protein